jgi:hypothetical protein
MTPTTFGDRDMTKALDALRQAESHVAAPPRLEKAVLAAWDRAHARRAAAKARMLWRRVAAIAAMLTIAAGLGQLGLQLQRSAQTTQTDSQPPDGSRTLLLVGEPILQGEPVRVVRMRVPAATLSELGVRPAEGDVAAHVDVDVIVGEDGIARAIRVGM